jgi:CheY-like chemotaxis protein
VESSVSLAGKRILLAEDDPVSAMAEIAMLQKQGIVVTHVPDGQGVLLALAQDSFDVVLMDVQMPVMDGAEATRAIRAGRAGEEMRHVPIIAMTAYAMAGDKDVFLEAGMNDYVAKPMSIQDLLRVIQEVLANCVDGHSVDGTE